MGMTDPHLSTGDPALALSTVLSELVTLLERMSDIDYAWRPRAEVSGSIGAHVRHCVDHVQVVLDRCADAVISFDERRRGTAIEHSRAIGLDALRRSVDRLHSERMPPMDEPLLLDARLDHAGACVRVESSVGRELIYVLQHTIHHNAVIALLLASRSGDVPARFGYAPSTPAVTADQRQAVECAR